MNIRLCGLSILLLLALGCGSKDKKEPIPTADGGVFPMSPLVVAVTTPPSPQGGNVTIDYSLINTEVPPLSADVRVRYSVDGGEFLEATEVAGGEGTTNLTSAPAPGAAHAFVWDTLADLGMGVFDVVVWIMPFTTGTADRGIDDRTDHFEVANLQAEAGVSARVMDPKLGGDPTIDMLYRLDPEGIDFTVTVTVLSASTGTEVRRLVDAESRAGGVDHAASWDGRDASGRFVDAGAYTMTFEGVYGTLPPMTASEEVHVVRLGVSAVEFVGNGSGSEEYQLMYHIRNTSRYSYYAIPDDRPQWAIGPESGDLADLDTDDGLARPLPAAWTETYSPPQDSSDTLGVEDDNYNLPTCYRRAATPRLEVTIGSSGVSHATPGTAMGCGYPIDGLPIRVVAAGATPETTGGNENISPGSTVSFIASTALPDAIQKHDLSYDFTFEYQDGGTWNPIPGTVTTTHTVYTIHDEPVLTTDATPTPPYLAWVALVDLVAEWVDGPATADEIGGIVTEEVNTFFGIQYDIYAGACHYTSGSTSSHTMEMSDFLDDWDDGSFSVVNCSDCGCLMSTFANAVGVDHTYEILGMSNRIQLNYQIPIGRSWQIPFYGSFRYHSVSTIDSGSSISDACCTLDDDSDPGSSPHVAILPQNMAYATYKQKLSWNPSSWDVYSSNRCRMH